MIAGPHISRGSQLPLCHLATHTPTLRLFYREVPDAKVLVATCVTRPGTHNLYLSVCGLHVRIYYM